MATVAEALALLQSCPPPYRVILDIGHGDELVYPVADALRARGTPFMFVTGYDACALPEAYADVPLMKKPVVLEQALLAQWC